MAEAIVRTGAKPRRTLVLVHFNGEEWGLKNAMMDIQPGLRWDITESINVNPYLNLIPGALRWNNINWGVVVMASLT